MTQEQKEKQEINKAWLGVFALLGKCIKKFEKEIKKCYHNNNG